MIHSILALIVRFLVIMIQNAQKGSNAKRFLPAWSYSKATKSSAFAIANEHWLLKENWRQNTCRMQGSLYKCLTKWIIAVSHSDSTWVTAVLKLSLFRSLGRVQTFMTQQDWQYGSRVVAWGQKGIFFIFILLLRGKYLLLLAVNTPSKNSLEFGRRAGWTLDRARSRGDSEWGSLQTALPGLGRGNSVMSGSQWLGLASGHKSIYRLRLSHGASMQQETKRASYFLTQVFHQTINKSILL